MEHSVKLQAVDNMLANEWTFSGSGLGSIKKIKSFWCFNVYLQCQIIKQFIIRKFFTFPSGVVVLLCRTNILISHKISGSVCCDVSRGMLVIIFNVCDWLKSDNKAFCRCAREGRRSGNVHVCVGTFLILGMNHMSVQGQKYLTVSSCK